METRNNTDFNNKIAVLRWAFPRTAKFIIEDTEARVSIIYWDIWQKAMDKLSIDMKYLAPEDRNERVEHIEDFLRCRYWEHIEKIFKIECDYFWNSHEEAKKFHDTAKKIVELTWRSFSESVNFLLKTASDEKKTSEIKIPHENAVNQEKNLWEANIHTGLSEEDKIFIRCHVAKWTNRKDKKKRRIEMANKYNLTVRQVWNLTYWSCGASASKVTEAEWIKNTTTKHISKRELFREYLDEFFEGKLMTPKACGITYRDMHECFCKDTKVIIDYAEVPKIWQTMLQENSLNTPWVSYSERKMSVSIVKSREELLAGKFVIDKSCNVLLKWEVQEAMQLEAGR